MQSREVRTALVVLRDGCLTSEGNELLNALLRYDDDAVVRAARVLAGDDPLLQRYAEDVQEIVKGLPTT